MSSIVSAGPPIGVSESPRRISISSPPAEDFPDLVYSLFFQLLTLGLAHALSGLLHGLVENPPDGPCRGVLEGDSLDGVAPLDEIVDVLGNLGDQLAENFPSLQLPDCSENEDT